METNILSLIQSAHITAHISISSFFQRLFIPWGGHLTIYVTTVL